MRVLRSLDELGGITRSVVTIGNFDGVHRGHQSVLLRVVERARQLHAASVVITFDPHPLQILRPGDAPRVITPAARKLELLSASGVDCVLLLPFTEELSRMGARAFAAEVLHQGLRAVEVHEGENFRFGHQATGDMASLVELGRELGFAVVAYAPLHLRHGIVSSTRARAAIAEGQLALARALLGRPFAVRSTPARGRGYGTRYAVPTINLASYDGLLPPHGVYITDLEIGTRCFEGVTNVGNRPTFGADSFAVETYLLRFEPVELSEETPLLLTFHRRLRPEMKWDSPELLRAQIQKDVARAERWFQLRRVLAASETTPA